MRATAEIVTPVRTRARSLLLTVGVALWALASTATGCERKAIPARVALEPSAAAAPDPLLEGGRLVFEDDFDRAVLGESWTTTHDGWRVVGGEIHSTQARNEGLWLTVELPTEARIEFDARSEPLPGGAPFPGDLKCEVFAERPEHQAGYLVINGGWNNQLDVIARQDEHGADRAAQAARAVEPSRTYRWAVVRKGATLSWFRDGALVMRYEDAQPIAGHYFGFNNWEASVFFDHLRVFSLED